MAAAVAIVARNADKSAQAVAELQKLGAKAVAIEADVSKAADVEAMVAAAVKTWGRLDYALNNAGVGESRVALADMSEEIWDRTLSINLKGVWLCMKYEILQMLKQNRGGAIVNTASAAGLVGSHGMPSYAAAKHGVVGLTKTAALEYAKAGIRVNAVCPGVTQTPMVEAGVAQRPRMREVFKNLHPMGRLGRPEEIGEAVAWHCPAAPSSTTGAALPVEGGLPGI